MKVKIWQITGYKGRDNYDGPTVDNLNFSTALDSRFKKKDVEEIFTARYAKTNRVVVIRAAELAEKEI